MQFQKSNFFVQELDQATISAVSLAAQGPQWKDTAEWPAICPFREALANSLAELATTAPGQQAFGNSDVMKVS